MSPPETLLELNMHREPDSILRRKFDGDGVPRNRSPELMTPAALHAAGRFATRRKAGFFVREGRANGEGNE
jgi:hypothetical protein